MQHLDGLLADERAPLLCHICHTLLQTVECLLVAGEQLGMTAIEILGKDAYHGLFVEQQVAEVEQLEQQLAMVFLLQHGQHADAAARIVVLPDDIGIYIVVVDDGILGNGRRQHQPFERAAAAQRHIHLSGGKRHAGIDDSPLERQSLTFVNGDGPRQAQRILAEGADAIGFYLACLLVQFVLGVLPLQRFHVDGCRVALTEHADTTLSEPGHTAYTTVIVALLPSGVVLDKHHLRALFQLERLTSGIGQFGEGTLDVGLVVEDTRGEFLQFAVVIPVGAVVVRGQADIAILWPRDEVALVTLVESVEHRRVGMAVANGIEQRDERVVLLTEHTAQFDGHIVDLRQCLRTEEERCGVIRSEHLLILGGHHGRQLLQVANHEQLHSAEGFAMVAETAQHRVHGIEQVAAHHRHLVDDKQVERGNDATFLAPEVELALDGGIGHIGRERQLEERVDGHATGIDGGHARGCYHDESFARAFDHGLEESGLARSGLAGEENAAAGMLDKVPGCAKLVVTYGLSRCVLFFDRCVCCHSYYIIRCPMPVECHTTSAAREDNHCSRC